MAGLTNELADLLTQLLALRKTCGGSEENAAKAIEAYYDFLERTGIEHCNFGGWQIADDGAAVFNAFNGSLLPDTFLEEYSAELVADDPVMRRGELLSPVMPVTRFDIGLAYIDEMRAFHDPAARVMQECARYGIEDGYAIIGDTSLMRSANSARAGRYFGFCFAGAPGTNAQVKRNINAVEIATFALLDQIMPQVEASIDGFQGQLTPRERDCLAAIADGSMRKKIAFDLNIALPTVDMHIASIKRKLVADTLPEAVSRAYRYGLL